MNSNPGKHVGVLRFVVFVLWLVLTPGAGALAATITYMFSGTVTSTFGADAVAMIGAVGDPSKVVAGTLRCNNATEVAIALLRQSASSHTCTPR